LLLQRKKQSRTAAEGIVVNVAEGGKAVILEVNCETDFVAKGDDFKKFASDMAEFALTNSVNSAESLRDQKADASNELTLKCGEKIDIRRMIFSDSENALGFYNHGGKIGVVVEAKTSATGEKLDELLKDISMHVAAASPRFLTANDIDESFKEREAKIYSEQLKEQGKPENMIPGIVQGKLKKLASEVCLLEQKFVKNPDLSVSAHIETVSKELGASVELVGFNSLVLGEGIEKRVDNLADEVAKMTGQQ
jgi:elongation factor Ts